MDLERLKALIDLVSRTRVAELEVVEDGCRIRIVAAAREGAAPSVSVSPSDGSAQVGPFEAGSVVEAPLYGILHLAPAPGEPPFVTLGADVEAGQTLCLIESMKVLTPIAAPVAGKVAAIPVGGGSEVEPGQPLFRIE